MFNFFSIFSRDKNIKKHSLTMTPTTEGENNKAKFSPEVELVLRKIKAKQEISNEELNKVIRHYASVDTIPTGFFKLHKFFAESMIFEIKKIATEEDTEGNIVNIRLSLYDVTLSNDMEIKVSVKDFHELFFPQSFNSAERTSS